MQLSPQVQTPVSAQLQVVLVKGMPFLTCSLHSGQSQESPQVQILVLPQSHLVFSTDSQSLTGGAWGGSGAWSGIALAEDATVNNRDTTNRMLFLL